MRWFFARKIRSRLTLWYIAVLTLILAVYILLVFTFQYRFISNQIFHDEVQDVETVEGLLYFDHSGTMQLKQDYFSHPRSHLLLDRLMEVRDLSGAVLYRTPSLHGMPLGGPLRPNEGEDSFDHRVFRLADATHVSLISHTHGMQGRTVVIRLGYSLVPLRDQMTQFTEILLIALPIALTIAAAAGYQIAKRALLPVEEMAIKAQQITARNLHDRLHAGNTEDELGRMATVLNELLQRLEQSFMQLHQFTADAAHELRAPLAAMRSIGEVSLRRQDSSESDKDAIASMLEESARLEEMIGGLLLLARAESAQALGPNTFSFVEVVTEVLALLDVLAEERGIRVETDLQTKNGTAVTGDRSLIRSAVMNVVHNAVKFAPDNTTIKVTYRHLSDRNSELSVEDQGPGVQESEREAVFERFYTSRNRGTVGNSGTGLGLSIARLVIERSGGAIFFGENASSSGARCIIHLPLHGLNDGSNSGPADSA